MTPQKPVQKLLTTNMSRRDFLRVVGASGLAVIGVTSLIRGLGALTSKGAVASGYGSSAYGGSNEPAPRARRL